MKSKLLILFLFLSPSLLSAQKNNKNSLTVKVDGVEMQAPTRKVNFGKYVYYTSNLTKPETMLRIWIGNFSGGQANESGTYLVINGDIPPSKKEIKEKNLIEKYKGIAVVRYVLETKSPRMTYHVGDSGNKDETITVKNTGDGNLEISFNVELDGTHWKEKASATVFGGLGRLQSKAESKIISKTTGFDWNIDPEGNGYRKEKENDTIKLSEGKMIIKLKEGE
ncbi:MAG TPA: hypothetical protein VLZ83_15640 [Edaphocola sp.]|nr:hypothetical protein [Edaphocola sp.]